MRGFPPWPAIVNLSSFRLLNYHSQRVVTTAMKFNKRKNKSPPRFDCLDICRLKMNESQEKRLI